MFNAYNPMMARERIDNQIAQLQQMKEQIPMQQPSINQTFQLAPTNNGIKYVDTINEVEKELIVADTPYFSRDMSVVWVKNIKGEIKAYELKEIVQKDEKDLMIESLQLQIEELKKGEKNANNTTNDAENDTNDDEQPKNKKSSNGKSNATDDKQRW